MKEISGILHQRMLENITKKPMTTPKVLRAVSSQRYVLPRFSVFIQMFRWQSPSGLVEETGQYSEGHGGAAKSWAGGPAWWSVCSGKRSHYSDVGVGHRYWTWQETDYANQGTTCMYTNNGLKYRQRLIIWKKKIIWKLAQLKSFNEIILPTKHYGQCIRGVFMLQMSTLLLRPTGKQHQIVTKNSIIRLKIAS